MPLTTCSWPGCDAAVGSGYCAEHQPRTRTPDTRPSAAQRGYGARWRSDVRPSFLAANPTCVLCGRPSEVPDHHPYSRRELVAAGVADPDDPTFLRALCTTCHNRETARTRR